MPGNSGRAAQQGAVSTACCCCCVRVGSAWPLRCARHLCPSWPRLSTWAMCAGGRAGATVQPGAHGLRGAGCHQGHAARPGSRALPGAAGGGSRRQGPGTEGGSWAACSHAMRWPQVQDWGWDWHAAWVQLAALLAFPADGSGCEPPLPCPALPCCGVLCLQDLHLRLHMACARPAELEDFVAWLGQLQQVRTAGTTGWPVAAGDTRAALLAPPGAAAEAGWACSSMCASLREGH